MIDNIAKALGVSKTTVSRALSGNGRVSEKTRERILRYTAEIGYVPNAAARNLATTKTRNIAFSMPLNRDATRSSYFLECFFGVSNIAASASYDLIMVGDELDQINRIIQSRKADGMVLTRNIIGDAALERLADAGIPIVLTGVTTAPNVTQVSYDGMSAFKDLTSLLIDSWGNNIGLIVTNHAYPANKARAQGFSDAFHAKHLPPPVIAWDAVTEDDMYLAFRKLYESGIRNIICGDDVVCVGILNFIKGGGRYRSKTENKANSMRNGAAASRTDFELIRYSDINLASFHDSHYLATFHPEIPVVNFDPRRLGDAACKMLISKIEGSATPAVSHLDYEIRI